MISFTQLFRSQFTARTWIILITLTLSIVFSLFFPVQDVISGLLSSLVFLVILPFSVRSFAIRESRAEFGIEPRLLWPHFRLALSLYLICAFILIALITLFGKEADAALPVEMTTSFWRFFLYIFLISSVFIYSYEYLFHNFFMIGVAPTSPLFGTLFAWLSLMLFLIASGTANWSNFSLIVAFLASGYLFYKTRSVFFSFLFVWSFVILTSAYFTLL